MSGSTLCFVAADGHGTAGAAVSANSAMTVTSRYFDPFGASRGAVPSWPDQNTFLGKPADSLTATVQLGDRTYDPALGRFLTPDPVLHTTDPQQMNGYAYAGNDPVNGSDPSGDMFPGPGNGGPAPHPLPPNPSDASGGPARGGATTGRPAQTSASADGGCDKQCMADKAVFLYTNQGNWGGGGLAGPPESCTDASPIGLCYAEATADKDADRWHGILNELSAALDKAENPCDYSFLCSFKAEAGEISGVTGCRNGSILECASLLPIGTIAKVAVVGGAAAKIAVDAHRVADLAKLARAGSKSIASFKEAAKYGIGPAKKLQAAKRGKDTGLETHPLIEQRFADVVGQKSTDMLSINLTEDEHQAFTNAWREAEPYGQDYSLLSKAQIEGDARKIYGEYPEILDALGLE